MRKTVFSCCAIATTVLAGASCGVPARIPVAAETGPHPVIPPPKTSIIPVMQVVKAKGWPGDETPIPGPGLNVRAFARGLSHPRWLYVLPNGDVLVAETNYPQRPNNNGGLRGLHFKVSLT